MKLKSSIAVLAAGAIASFGTACAIREVNANQTASPRPSDELRQRLRQVSFAVPIQTLAQVAPPDKKKSEVVRGSAEVR